MLPGVENVSKQTQQSKKEGAGNKRHCFSVQEVNKRV